MSIKSEKAKEYIEKYRKDSNLRIPNAQRAVEIAESEAKQRAYEFAIAVFRDFLRGDENYEIEASTEWFKRRLLGDDVIRSESDARERAVRAHAKERHYRIGDRATCRLSDFHTPCDAIPQCNWKQNFLKHYDNE